MNERPITFDPTFGSFIIETLTVGMYEEPRNAIREYVQNAFDSTREAIKRGILKEGDGHIAVTMNPNDQKLTIRDNGVGISAERAVHVLTSIGASSKTYKKEAGFRGIGRLAGIAFANHVRFTTKFRGELQITEVSFDGALMRDLMQPQKASELSAQELLKKTISTKTTNVTDSEEHFFEVHLSGFSDAPKECLSVADMRSFLSQVAPVGFGHKFPFTAEVEKAAADTEIKIETISISIQFDSAESEKVTKPYADRYAYKGKTQSAAGTVDDIPDDQDESDEAYNPRTAFAALTSCEIYKSPTGRWFMWVGQKRESGAFTDPGVWGLRVRVKNIQIDGTEIMGSVFAKESASNYRFNQWCVGEVYLKTDALIPNARRDGFEDDANWKSIKSELYNVCKTLAKDFRALSSRVQLTVEKLRAEFDSVKGEALALRGEEPSVARLDRAIGCASHLRDLQARIERSIASGKIEDRSALVTMISEAKALRIQTVSLVRGEQPDLELIRQEARNEQLTELMNIFESHLKPDCLGAVRRIVRTKFGYSDD